MVAARAVVAEPEHPLALGHARPRVRPGPLPLKHRLPELRAEAAKLGISYMPGQETALRYITAVGRDGLHLYSEVAVVAARQNGKTTLVEPVITDALRHGLKVMHLADKRELPRQMFRLIADALSDEPDLFPKRRGKTIWPRYGSGQEEIVLNNHGEYRIAAASSGGARGWQNDLVIIDEMREFKDLDTEQAVMATVKMSRDPQFIYLSNAGSEQSVWINNLRLRAGEDPNLAYLEWSAAPDRDPSDVRGWAEANWALGHYPQVVRELEKAYQRAVLTDTMAQFETEMLCRWVISLDPPVVKPEAWERCHGDADMGGRTSIGINVDPSGTRASAVAAWLLPDGRIALRVIADVRGDPIAMEQFGPKLREKIAEVRGHEVAFDPWTDAELATYVRRPRKLRSDEYASACSEFAAAVDTRRIVWSGSDEISEDLRWTTRKDHPKGGWLAVKASEDHSITAAIAAIRAVKLANVPASGAGVGGIY